MPGVNLLILLIILLLLAIHLAHGLFVNTIAILRTIYNYYRSAYWGAALVSPPL